MPDRLIGWLIRPHDEPRLTAAGSVVDANVVSVRTLSVLATAHFALSLGFGCGPRGPAPGPPAASVLPRVPLDTPAAALEPVEATSTGPSFAPNGLSPQDIFELEWVEDPRISPDGRRIAYLRKSFDIMTDSTRSNLWVVDADGRNHRPLVTSHDSIASPRWSPDGERILYSASTEKMTQLFVRWLDTGQTTQLTQVRHPISEARWSPDGESLALIMSVDVEKKPMVRMPQKPEGAEWAPPAKVVDQLVYRLDGRGMLEESYAQLHVLPAEGGTPRPLTQGAFRHASPSWTPDGRTLVISGHRTPDWQYDPLNSELYAVDVGSSRVDVLTERAGPDRAPQVSPDGRHIAYLGFDDRKQGYQVTRAYVMPRAGGEPRLLTESFDRDVQNLKWSSDSRGLYFQYDDRGNTKIGYLPLQGDIRTLAENVGGTSLGRPYASGGYSVSRSGRIAFTLTRPEHPAELAVLDGGSPRLLTNLNGDVLGHKTLATVESMTVESSDGYPIQSWIAKPPGFRAGAKYPLILEIHGGPFANYGDRFAAEIQLYAAAGFVVLYVNPRGSTSYGETFGNLIHHAYPGDDYGDLMASVDALLERGYVDPERLYVTGGSGGGVLTAWTVGKTDRFRAAVVAKPVINWTSFVLYADLSVFFAKYWFPDMPWAIPEHYQKRSPLSLVDNVKTPTMLLTGEADYRTPIAESEQYYQALKLRRIDTALVRIPDASHGIAKRPSHLIAKVLHILAWFERYPGAAPKTANAS